MKQRLMALAINFEKAFNTVTLISKYSWLMDEPTMAIFLVERYVDVIQLLDNKERLDIADMRELSSSIEHVEEAFQKCNSNLVNDPVDFYCPWAENVSSSIEEELIEVVNYPIDETASFSEQNLVTIAPSIEEKMDALLNTKNY